MELRGEALISNKMCWINDTIFIYADSMILVFDTLTAQLQTKHSLTNNSRRINIANMQIVRNKGGLLLSYFHQRDENKLVFDVIDVWGNVVQRIDSFPYISYKNIKLSQDGNYILIGGLHDAIVIEIDRKDSIFQRFRADKTEWVWGLDLSIQNKLLITGGNEKVLRIWDISTGLTSREIVYPTDEFIKHIYISPNNKWMATSGHSSNRVFIWDLNTFQISLTLEAQLTEVNTIQSDATGDLVALSSAYGSISVIDTQKMTNLLKLEGEQWEFVASIAFSPDNKKLALYNVSNNILYIVDILSQGLDFSAPLIT
jgi:WD40 repeat protein